MVSPSLLSNRLVSGVGELDISSSSPHSNGSPLHQQQLYQSSPGKDDSQEMPYLLLDVRDTDKYQQCHIITGNLLIVIIIVGFFSIIAQSYPLCMLSRSRNPYTKEMYHYVSSCPLSLSISNHYNSISLTNCNYRRTGLVVLLSFMMKMRQLLLMWLPNSLSVTLIMYSCSQEVKKERERERE